MIFLIRNSHFDLYYLYSSTKFYYAKSAHYETATLGSIMLVSGERIHKALKEDYQAMHNMIYAKMPEYEEIIGYLCKLAEGKR